jgi:putative glycosyltransferase (TIGR04348 family)
VSSKKTIALITPALPQANNGNSHTAWRWYQFLQSKYHVKLLLSWDDSPCDGLIALHARRSADSIDRFASKYGGRVALVLTGTDVYRDIYSDQQAARSLQLAQYLVTLQPAAKESLNAALQAKTRVIYQSAPTRSKLQPRKLTFDLIMVGHIRAEKDPLTAALAVNSLRMPAARLKIIGEVPQDELGRKLNSIGELDSRITLVGAQSHAITRQQMSLARLLIISSVMEGGANVIIEAITCGTPILASRVDGNIGMLGQDYEGYFELGQANQLAALIERAQSDLAFFDRLVNQCARRAALFKPANERAGVLKLAADLLAG